MGSGKDIFCHEIRQASLDYQKRGFISIMADMSTILGVVLMSIGGIFVLTGMVLCYVTKGEYYNQDEVQAMVAAEVLEEEMKKKEEADAIEAEIKAEMMAEEMGIQLEDEEMGKKKERGGPMTAN